MSEVTQPQLLAMCIADSDVVYTAGEVAQNIIDHFNPSGYLLDPCRGDGAFYDHFPARCKKDYCEITESKDFFNWTDRVDWIIGNPPYSIFHQFIEHAFSVADNVVFLVPTNKIFQSWKTMGLINRYGGIKGMLVYGSGNLIGFPFGFSVGAFHFRRDYFDSPIVMSKPLESWR